MLDDSRETINKKVPVLVGTKGQINLHHSGQCLLFSGHDTIAHVYRLTFHDEIHQDLIINYKSY